MIMQKNLLTAVLTLPAAGHGTDEPWIAE